MLRQAQKNLLSSPLAINQLLTIIRSDGAVKKYLQIRGILQDKEDFQNETLHLTKDKTNVYSTACNIKNIKFEDNNEAISILNKWINERYSDHNILKEVIEDKKWILANYCSYKGRWKMDKFTKMIVHNSFNYTEDIKYEGRLLEYLLHDEDFKIVVVVPNETDVIHELVHTLTTDGLQAAILKTQPSFSTESVVMAPKIVFSSKFRMQEIENCSMFEFGDVKINEKEISITVFTGLMPGKRLPTIRTTVEDTRKFYFALAFRDTAIITGRYTRET